MYLVKLQISEENCYWALSISTDSHYQIHLKEETIPVLFIITIQCC